MVLSQNKRQSSTTCFYFFPPSLFSRFSPNKSSCNDRYTPCHVFLGKSDGVFSHHCFASRCVRSYKHRVVVLQPEYGLLLENIQLKWPLIKKKSRHKSYFIKRNTWWSKIWWSKRKSCYSPGTLGWGCVYRNRRRVKLYSQESPIFYSPLIFLLSLFHCCLLSLLEMRIM